MRPSKSAAKKSVAAGHADATKRTRRMPSIAARDDTEVTALKLKPAKLSPAMAAFFKTAEEKVGFVPNVLKAFAFDMTKLEAFLAYRNDLMLGDSGLSKLEREMIAVVVSSALMGYSLVPTVSVSSTPAMRRRPRRSRDFAVPSGMPSTSATCR